MKIAEVDLVLASTSRYRRELLGRIAPRLRCVAPGVEETRQSGEAAADLARRLAAEKARAVAAHAPGAVVIGSDQVADRGGLVLGKPGDAATARIQLAACSGATVLFHTAVCLIDRRSGDTVEYAALDRTEVAFRPLTAATIAAYVEREQPLDCAGSFKCEGLGIALFERIGSDDPTALIGLPLIAVCRLLRTAGIEVI
ncbi:MAG TPA: Maf family nucleotide pyrophosphatase [Dokdonella sp.]|uniref:Maf family protein n=1 Tax=Dokdonella sp. TaxID=2291710 RepID=UPI002BB2BCC0|nr:Maf family nucleotide pyrophosphatase [Dokdonella sp.]HUD40727.1 Maf family nucleotide pyrophosphatase [Dokdonella sp.]